MSLPIFQTETSIILLPHVYKTAYGKWQSSTILYCSQTLDEHDFYIQCSNEHGNIWKYG